MRVNLIALFAKLSFQFQSDHWSSGSHQRSQFCQSKSQSSRRYKILWYFWHSWWFDDNATISKIFVHGFGIGPRYSSSGHIPTSKFPTRCVFIGTFEFVQIKPWMSIFDFQCCSDWAFAWKFQVQTFFVQGVVACWQQWLQLCNGCTVPAHWHCHSAAAASSQLCTVRQQPGSFLSQF